MLVRFLSMFTRATLIVVPQSAEHLPSTIHIPEHTRSAFQGCSQQSEVQK